MPALRTLVHPRRARIRAAVLTHAHACPALLPTFLSRFLCSTCKHNADLHPGSRCGLAAKLPSTHAPLSQEHTCDARDSQDRGTRASQIRARGKGQKKPESLELWHRKVSVIESCEQVWPAGATALRKSRALKSASSEHLAAVLKVLEEFLGSSERASQALAASPAILYQRSELLEQKLTALTHFGMREEVFRKLCTTPCVLSRKLESLLRTLNLLEEIGLSEKSRNTVLWVQSRIVRTTGMTMVSALNFFKSLGMDGAEISKLMERRPTMFAISVHALMGYYTFYRQLGLSANEFTRVTCAGFPTLAIATLQARVEFLKGQGFSGSDVHLLIVQQPRILGLRCNYLQEKLNFLLCEQKYDTADIVRCPVCLMLSLQDRLIPRLTAVKERGLFKVYALSTILVCRDAVFQQILGTRGKRR